MAETSATIRLKAIDENVANTLGNISTATATLTGVSIGLQFGLGALEKVSRSTFSQFLIGVDGAERLGGALNVAATNASKFGAIVGKLSDLTFLGSQGAIVAQGVTEAAQAFSRIPQTLESFQASGVSTKSIQDFYALTGAVKGSGASVDSFVTSAIAQLGQFEQAAARAGTILRSSTRFSDTGQAQRAARAEQLQNAFQVQKLVNTELDNTVSSTAALSAQYDVLSSGFTKAADSQQVLAAGLKLVGIGEAGGVSAPVSETTRLLTSTMNAYEQTAEQAKETAGVINGIVESGLTTIPELLDLGATAKQASAAGISLKDLGAGIATLTSQGVNTAESLTGLSRVAGGIINKTPQAQEALDKLSLSGQKIRFDKAEIQSKGLVQALTDINKAAGGSAQTLAQIFPEEVAYRTVLALLAQSGEKLKATRENIEGAGSQSLDEVFKIASEDRISRMEKIANRFQEAIIQIAASLAPVLEPGLNALEGIASVFNGLPDSVKQGIGSFIALQIQTRASAGALGILVGVIRDLAANYLIARGVTLLFTGQLGQEVGVIRDLITQRKGLLAVALQIFGIDQKRLLLNKEATDVITKQSFATRLLTNAREKLTEVVGRNVQGFKNERLTAETAQQLKETGGAIASQVQGAVVTGVTKVTKEEAIISAENLLQQVKTKTIGTAQEIGKSGRTIGTGLAQAVGILPTPQILGPDGKPLSSSGLQSVTQEFQRIGQGIKVATQGAYSGIVTQFEKPIEAIGEKAKLAGEVVAENLANPEAVKQRVETVRTQIVGEIEGLKAQSLQDLDTITAESLTTETTKKLVDRDVNVRQKSAQNLEDKNRLLNIQSELQLKNAQAEEITQRIEAKSTELIERRNAATQIFLDQSVSRADKQKALNALTKDEEILTSEQLRLQEVQARAAQLQGQLPQAQRAVDSSDVALLNAEAQAQARLLPVAQATAQARLLETKALQAKQFAQLAAAEATQLEIALLVQDERAIASRTRARVLETEATQLETLATQKAATANALYTTEVRASELAEKGLAEARVFGNSIIYATTGPLAGLNKLLASEITLKGTAAIATNVLGAANSGLGAFVGGVGELLRGDFSKLSGIGTGLQAVLGGIGKAGQVGFGAVKSGVQALLAPLGLVGPLALAAGFGLVAFREDIFGVGASIREASKGFEEFEKKQAVLEDSLGKRSQISVLREKTKALINDTNYLGESVQRVAIKTETTQRGIVDQISGLPSDTLGKTGSAVGRLFSGIGKGLNDYANKELDRATAPATKLQPIRIELDQLRESGAITSGQFATLAKSLNDVGAAGDINKEKLKSFKLQLDATLQGAAGEKEKGFIDSLGEKITGIPNQLGRLFDFVTAIPGGLALAAKDIGNRGLIDTAINVDDYAYQAIREREADRLVKPISEIGIALEQTGNASLSTQESIKKYNQGLGLTADISEKIRQGKRLSAIDFEGENEEFSRRQKINEGIVGGLNEQIKKYEEVATKIKDSEQKAIFQGRVDALKKEVEQLEKGNAKLKERRDFLVKYQTETLPNIIQALNENTDPATALKKAGETFNQQFVTDPKTGKATPFLKDISTLRQESQRYQQQVLDSLESGVFDQGIEQAYGVKLPTEQASQEAARRLREARDNKITYSEDGVQKEGYRLALSDRKALTKQIAELDNEGLKLQEARANRQIEIDKNSQRDRTAGEVETESKILELSGQNLERRRRQLFTEIEERRKAHLKTTDLEQQAQELLIQIEANAIEKREKLRDREFQRRLKQLNVEGERLKTAQTRRTVTGEEGEEGTATLLIKRQEIQLQRLREDRARRKGADPDLDLQIQEAEAQLEGARAGRDEQRRQRRIKRRETDFQLEQEQVKVAATNRTISTEASEKQVSAIETKAAQARLKDLEELYNKSGRRDVDLAKDIAKQRLEIERIQGEAIEKERQRQIARREAQFDIESAQIQLLVTRRSISQREAERRTDQIQIESAQARLGDLEKLYEKSGRTDIDLAQQISKARIDIETKTAAAIEKEQQRQIQWREAQFEIESAQVQLLLTKRSLGAREAERQTDQIQIESAQGRLADLEKLYEKSGRTDIDLAQQISKARIDIETKTAAAIEKEREYQFQQNQSKIKNDVQTEILIRQQALNQGQIQQKDLEIRNKYADDAKQLLASQNQATEAQLQNSQKLIGDTVVRASIDRQISENRLANLGKQQKLERLSLENQKEIVKITSEREVAQARLQQLENQRDLQLAKNELVKARRERRTEEETRTIEIQIQGLENQNDLINQQVAQAERSKKQQLDALANQESILTLTQLTAAQNAQTETRLARITEYQATLTKAAERVGLAEQIRQARLQQSQKTNETISKAYEQQLGLLEGQAKVINTRNEFVTGELSIAADLTKDETERKSIAEAIATIKLQSAQEQIKYERTVLELNQQQRLLQLESERITNRVSQSQNLAEVAKARAELAKLLATPAASQEEITAARLQLYAREQEGKGLKFAEMGIGQQEQLAQYTQSQERNALEFKSQLTLDQAKAEVVKNLPEGMADIYAQGLKTQVLARAGAYGGNPSAQGIGLLGAQTYYAPNNIAPQYALPDIQAIRRNAEAMYQEFNVTPPQIPIELQPRQAQEYIDQQLGQLQPIRKEFEQMRQSLSSNAAVEALSRRVGELQQQYQQQTPQVSVQLQGRPIIEKVVIENVSTNIQQNSPQGTGEDVEQVIFKTISNLTDRLQQEFR